MNTWSLTFPIDKTELAELRAGDRVFLTGSFITARDEAHKRLNELTTQNIPWPIDVQGELIYYVGPSPGFADFVVGAAGPTTSSRMDSFTPLMLERGAVATMGKGYRGDTVKEAMLTHKAVYFVATGGAGALLGSRIKRREIIAYEDLGPEAIARVWVEDFPALVAFDTHGNDIYQQQSEWRNVHR
ncbi:FumA C-terminus/TtdB family hydratase beta subunit [Alicyclobacillus fastidiosus]|uniref:FumA C-terminus/TtdB family hydratase beta subunit n=1 Tax=Alicyclobacillus fastidiosus TaxID=392011 RepID=A0ABY6ZMC2_9BACL|nr:FumA C-terminus/TtdB family hydratase beta subunit [Alicyclobacillus fastidiosus]WAH44078.1 FumA C-terminus/TtdB family hydratase beta subunit [Alicyclobacillus fastidiosus]GMA60366.1 fumarate hydratase [Alicyclobacillus fastidiosus]